MSDKRRDDDHDVANPITRAIALGIDRGTFGAINGASIVYDGAVVTDARFRTNDPCIWSAGPAARFARRYRNKLSPGLCSAREAGAKLGASLLAALDPLAPETARCCCGACCCGACCCGAVVAALLWRCCGASRVVFVAQDDTIPAFTSARAAATTLVGGVHYAHVTLPRAGCVDHAAVTAHRRYGRELVTDAGGCDEFTAVQIDASGARETAPRQQRRDNSAATTAPQHQRHNNSATPTAPQQQRRNNSATTIAPPQQRHNNSATTIAPLSQRAPPAPHRKYSRRTPEMSSQSVHAAAPAQRSIRSAYSSAN